MNRYMDEESENKARDLPSKSGYYVMDRDLFKRVFLDHAYIEVDMLHKGYYEDSIKPLILCKDCKFQDDNCDNCHRYDTDFYCKDGEAK